MKRTFSVFLLALLWLQLTAQNISVESFSLLENDLTANTAGTTVYDQNGEKCALIKVETTQTGFTFDVGSLGVVRNELHVGEIWLYVPAGVKRITIAHPQFGILRNYDFGLSLQRARSYLMKLNVGSLDVPQQQELQVKISPSHAVVIVESMAPSGSTRYYLDDSQDPRSLDLPIGSYNYTALATGYYRVEGAFSLNNDSKLVLPIELLPKPGLTAFVPQLEQAEESAVKEAEHSKPSKTQKSFGFYFEPQARYNEYFGVGLGIGMNLHRFNAEADVIFSVTASEMIGWYNSEGIEAGAYTYKPMIFDFKCGYNVINTPHFVMTPRLGASFMKAKATHIRGYSGLIGDGTNSTSALADVRFTYLPASRIGLSLTPQYAIRLFRSQTYPMLAYTSSQMNHWNNSYGITFGISYHF